LIGIIVLIVSCLAYLKFVQIMNTRKRKINMKSMDAKGGKFAKMKMANQGNNQAKNRAQPTPMAVKRAPSGVKVMKSNIKFANKQKSSKKAE